MKKISILILSLFLVTSLFGSKLKITKSEVLPIKISNSQPTVVQFNFLVKKIKKIFSQKNKTQVKLLDKGVVIIPDSKKTSGILIITNEQGTSYTITFKADKKGDSVINIDDLTYSKYKPTKLKLETQFVDRDVSNIITKLDNMDEHHLNLPGFKLQKDSYTIENKNKEYKMTKLYRWVGSKYVVDSWIIKNLTKKPLLFRNRDFARKGIISASIQPRIILPKGTASLYLITNKATLSSYRRK